MSENEPGSRAEGREALGLANAWRECLSSGAVIVDGQQQVVCAVGDSAHLLGLNADLQAHPPYTVLPEALQEMVREVGGSGKGIDARTVELVIAGRGPASLRVSAVPLPGREREGSVALLLTHLAPPRALEDRMRHLARLATAGTMAASLAHEIKNALVSGKTFIDLVLEKNQDLELAGLVRRELGRIEWLVSRMLNFARPEQRDFAAIGLHQVLEQSLRLVEPQRKTKGIELTGSFQAAPDVVKGDDYQLEQAFVNLFLNALEAMGENGTLSVDTQCTGGAATGALPDALGGAQVIVTIKDTGVGIPAKDMDRLFEPFFTTKSEGTGLGLAITKRIIQEHKGTIGVASQPGVGTTFKIRFPALSE